MGSSETSEKTAISTTTCFYLDNIEFYEPVRKNKLIDTAEALNFVDKSFFI